MRLLSLSDLDSHRTTPAAETATVRGPAALVCLQALPPAEAEAAGAEAAEAEEPTADPERRFEDMQVVTAEALARQFAERGRPVPESGAKIGFPRPFGDIFFAICVRQFHGDRQQDARRISL